MILIYFLEKPSYECRRGKTMQNLDSPGYLKSIPTIIERIDFQDMFWGNWCDTLEASRSISGVSLILHNFMKMVEFSFYPLEFLVYLASLSASRFIEPFKYLAVIVIFRFRSYCQLSLLVTVNSLFSVLPIFIKYGRTIMLSMRM